MTGKIVLSNGMEATILLVGEEIEALELEAARAREINGFNEDEYNFLHALVCGPFHDGITQLRERQRRKADSPGAATPGASR